ncbi:uncharacterized protein Eint_020040 [Encephalitozoon intestinalis ATCC 50506]|uniref:Uncharacterized protein n=1 Tax=Encephalitozoon intestinalis (strain ATCC 50506) TaxID=876142 RepID=E0S5M0_ENCIT|nr:uncharacterized protein Eint_020040 [Encephalitozoon intestinalis ATCC 50506]ADM11005.2 hypothetical protein Eint_020040 [Encephalitozoon intestinalis ATCC 50506]UTX44651.1 hypothetical protein GPK93_02g01660 [Encephalitozoon intestinalis]
MILNGDNRKIFINGEVVYKVGENSIEEYCKKDLVLLRRRKFFKIKVAREFDRKYYFLTRKKIFIYENLFEDPAHEVEVPSEKTFDFYVHHGQLFYLVQEMDRYLGINEEQEMLFDFEAGTYFWDGVDFYICSNKSLIRFDIVKRRSSEVLRDVNIKYLAVKNGMIAYTDDANVLNFLKGKSSLSYHYHARPITGIIITTLESLLVVCSSRKLVRIETKRDEKTFLTTFEGDLVDFVQDESNVYILTVFCLLVYDLKVGSTKKQIFSLPNFEYCKSLNGFENREEEIPGKEIFEHNIKKTKVKMPYVFQKEDFLFSSKNSIVAVRRDYIFIYDLEKEEMQRIAYLEGFDFFYSSGFIIGLEHRREKGRRTAKVYKIESDGLLLIGKYNSVETLATPADMVFSKGKLFLYLDGSLIEVIGPGITKSLINQNIRQIEETKNGIFLLDECGIFRVESEEWILREEKITSFRISGDTLFVSLPRDGVLSFEMKDGAAEENLISDSNVMDVFVEDQVILTFSRVKDASVLKRYRKDGNSWKKNGEALVDKRPRRIFNKNIYLSITNKLHKVDFS